MNDSSAVEQRIAAVRQQQAAAQRNQVAAQHSWEVADKQARDSAAALQEEFGVSSLEEAQHLLENLETVMYAELADVESKLNGGAQ